MRQELQIKLQKRGKKKKDYTGTWLGRPRSLRNLPRVS